MHDNSFPIPQIALPFLRDASGRMIISGRALPIVATDGNGLFVERFRGDIQHVIPHDCPAVDTRFHEQCLIPQSFEHPFIQQGRDVEDSFRVVGEPQTQAMSAQRLNRFDDPAWLRLVTSVSDPIYNMHRDLPSPQRRNLLKRLPLNCLDPCGIKLILMDRSPRLDKTQLFDQKRADDQVAIDANRRIELGIRRMEMRLMML